MKGALILTVTSFIAGIVFLIMCIVTVHSRGENEDNSEFVLPIVYILLGVLCFVVSYGTVICNSPEALWGTLRERRQNASVEYIALQPEEENAVQQPFHDSQELPSEMRREERQDPNEECDALQPEEENAFRIPDSKRRPPVQSHRRIPGFGDTF